VGISAFDAQELARPGDGTRTDQYDARMARAPIGWREAGGVDRLGRELIVTEFFHVLFVPLWPRAHSVYLFHDADGTERYFEIPQDRRSVALGFTRKPVWLAAIILGSGGLAKDDIRLLSIAFALAIVGAVLTFALGVLEPGERARRELLKRTTGLGAPPELMPAGMREHARDQLAHAWWREHETDWRSAILAGVADEKLVVIAEYDRAPQLLIRARTNLIDAEGN
jgi:hypothetical protein